MGLYRLKKKNMFVCWTHLVACSECLRIARGNTTKSFYIVLTSGLNITFNYYGLDPSTFWNNELLLSIAIGDILTMMSHKSVSSFLFVFQLVSNFCSLITSSVNLHNWVGDAAVIKMKERFLCVQNTVLLWCLQHLLNQANYSFV